MKKKTQRAEAVSLALAFCAACTFVAGCRDVSKFSSKNDRYEGAITNGSFVRSGVSEDVKMCLTLDTDRLQDAPGTLRTSDGRFNGATLRPIPQLWHDPLSTLTFGDGRIQNLLYAVSPVVGDAGPEEAQDVFVVLSLMQSNRIEARLLRGAPQSDAGATPAGVASAVFAVFHLEREPGACSF